MTSYDAAATAGAEAGGCKTVLRSAPRTVPPRARRVHGRDRDGKDGGVGGQVCFVLEVLDLLELDRIDKTARSGRAVRAGGESGRESSGARRRGKEAGSGSTFGAGVATGRTCIGQR